MHRSHKRTIVVLITATLAVAACNIIPVESEPPTSAPGGPAAPAESTTTTTANTTPPSTSHDSIPDDQGLALSGVRWATHGPDGVRLDDGTLVWVSEPFPAGVARDRRGGLVFTDSKGLWWLPDGESEPRQVLEEGGSELVSAIEGPSGPIAVLWKNGPMYIRLDTGEAVDEPAGAGVKVSPDGSWATGLTAGNGLTAQIVPPEFEEDAEGQPSAVRERARLMVTQGDDVLVDVPVGTDDQPWVTLHDFDGQTVLLSQGPLEPAMPEETFLFIDLSTGEITTGFTAAGTRATFTGDDVDWSGPVTLPEVAR